MRLASQPELLKSLGKVATTTSFDGRSSTAVDLTSQRSRPATAQVTKVAITAVTNDKILNQFVNKQDSGKLSNGVIGSDMTKKTQQLLDEARCQSNWTRKAELPKINYLQHWRYSQHLINLWACIYRITSPHWNWTKTKAVIVKDGERKRRKMLKRRSPPFSFITLNLSVRPIPQIKSGPVNINYYR